MNENYILPKSAIDKKSKTLKFDYFFVFVLIVYAGRGTSFVRSIETWDNYFGLIFVLVLTLSYGIYTKVRLSKSLIFLLIGYVFYFLLLSIKCGEFHYRFFGIYLTYFLISYVAVRSLGVSFFYVYEKIVYQLAKISIFLWLFLILFPGIVYDIIGNLSFLETGTENIHSNIFVYTLNTSNLADGVAFNLGPIKIYRNAGFSWEPGAFAVMIILAILTNFARKKFAFKNNPELLVLVLALITTFSTTGYGLFLLLILYFVVNQNLRNKIILIPLIFVLGLYFLTLPFMLDKIVNTSKRDTDSILRSSILYGIKQTPQRLNSFIIDFQDFLNNPVLGYGGHQDSRWTVQLGAEVSTISGIGKVFAQFGSVGVLFFFVCLILSSKFFVFTHGLSGWIFPFFVIIMISISYSLIFNPIFMSFWILALFNRTRTKIQLNE